MVKVFLIVMFITVNGYAGGGGMHIQEISSYDICTKLEDAIKSMGWHGHRLVFTNIQTSCIEIEEK